MEFAIVGNATRRWSFIAVETRHRGLVPIDPAEPSTAHESSLLDQGAGGRWVGRVGQRRAVRGDGPTQDGPVRRPRPTGWFGDQVAALLTALTTGAGRACRHLGPTPAIMHAAVWAPGQVVCPACVAALRPDPAEHSTCDRCRRHAGPLHAGAVAVGPVILAYGLCRTCVTAVGLTPTTRQRRSVTSADRPNRPPARRGRR